MLKLENLKWKTAEGAQIINGLSLDIPDGKLVVITGPNGGGKTTLAKLIAGIVKPDSGNIYLENEDITSLDVTQRAKRGVSFAFQQPVRFKGITVRKLIELASGNAMNEAKMCDILSQVGLCARDYIDREVNSTLSGGEIKRIEIATVLARHSKLSIFDEPEAGIDLWSFTNLIEVFKRLRNNLSGTIVIISHQERILKIADEIVLVADGKVKAVGNAEKMLGGILSAGDARPSCTKQEELCK